MAPTTNETAACRVTPEQILPCLENVSRFLERYEPHFARREQREHAGTYLEGLLSDLRRKTAEPIATAHDQERRPLQRFVGAGVFDDDQLIAELKGHVAEEIGDPAGVLIIDPTCFEKKGTESVGVARQWNGRLGKQDNCQKAVLLTYAAPQGFTTVDRRLYLPEEWAADRKHRTKCRVPKSITFKTAWQLGLDLVEASTKLPHAWVVADEEFGRPAEFRAELRRRGERYALVVPSNTIVRPIHAPPPPKRHRLGRPPRKRPLRASDWARERKSGAWVRILVRDGTKGPHYVQATEAEVETRIDGQFSVRERLVVVRTFGPRPEYWYILTNADPAISIGAVVCAHAVRHSIEMAIEQAKGEAGFAHYEVRSWVGWHHHVTFALLASWFLILERRRFRGRDAHYDCAANGSSRIDLAPKPAHESQTPRTLADSTADSNGGVTSEPLENARAQRAAADRGSYAVS